MTRYKILLITLKLYNCITGGLNYIVVKRLTVLMPDDRHI